MDLRREAECARDLVMAAGALAREMQGSVIARDKGGGEGPVTDADLAAEKLLLAGLVKHFPADAIVSEETLNRGVPAGTARIWCIDPIDGTREYVDGLREYASMAGLLVDGKPAAGAIALPGDGEGRVLWGWSGGGVFVDGVPTRLPHLDDPTQAIAIHSRSHRSTRLEEAMQQIAPRQRLRAGSVGFKAGQILTGRAHFYLHVKAGTQWWDSVGPAALVLAAGGSVGDARGTPLDYSGTSGRLDHAHGLLFCVPGLFEPLARLLAPDPLP